jgi:predicted neutral ceramidase superfamily lipid hydrolase
MNILEIVNSQSEATRSLMFTTILIWSIFWKGLALWHSARNKQKYWFVVLLIINTVGLLEIIFLVFLKRDRNNYPKDVAKKNR